MVVRDDDARNFHLNDAEKQPKQISSCREQMKNKNKKVSCCLYIMANNEEEA